MCIDVKTVTNQYNCCHWLKKDYSAHVKDVSFFSLLFLDCRIFFDFLSKIFFFVCLFT